MKYEVLVWTEVAKDSPLTYKPIQEIHGDIDTPEKAIAFAEDLMQILVDFKPFRYEVIEKRSVIIKDVKPNRPNLMDLVNRQIASYEKEKKA